MNSPKTITIDGVEYIRKDAMQAPPALSNRVLVRSRNAGVHVGTLTSRDSVDTVLINSNRIWRWRGANTLSEVALHGVNRDEYTRIAEPIEAPLTLTTSDVCEIIPVREGVDLTHVWNE